MPLTLTPASLLTARLTWAAKRHLLADFTRMRRVGRDATLIRGELPTGDASQSKSTFPPPRPPPAWRGEGRGWRWARRRHVLHGNDARPEDGGRVGQRSGLLGFRPGSEPVALERFFMGPRRFTPVGRAPGKRHIYSSLLGQFPSLPAPRPL